MELGLGTGLTIDPSYEMTGLPNWTNGERVARFGEYVELLDHLLAGGVTTYDGTYYQAKGAVMHPGSLQQPRLPIMVAALGPQMMHHAARHADIWNTMSFAADLEEQMAELDRPLQRRWTRSASVSAANPTPCAARTPCSMPPPAPAAG